MVVYIASQVPLQTWPFDAANPGFHVTDVPAQGEAVEGRFSKPFVYYAGSYEGCGCGFQYGREYPDYEDDREATAAAEASRTTIESYVRDALGRQFCVEIYACWSGDEDQPPESRRSIDIPEFPDGFKEREFITVGRPAAR